MFSAGGISHNRAEVSNEKLHAVKLASYSFPEYMSFFSSISVHYGHMDWLQVACLFFHHTEQFFNSTLFSSGGASKMDYTVTTGQDRFESE